MASRLSPRERELWRRCDEVLHYVWDPIGVAAVPAARDEYDSYLPDVFRLVSSYADPAAIVEHLVGLERDVFAGDGDAGRARQTVEVLIRWRDRLRARSVPKTGDASRI